MEQPRSQTAFTERLTQVAAMVETMLDRLLWADPLQGEILRPQRLLDSMRYATLGGGKRLRPFLTVETAALLGVPDDAALAAAAAVEMIHCYSLVHDDLPGMDDDDLRRGRPTVHKAFDEATAILAGDALLTYAFDVLTRETTHADARVRADLALGLARAAGIGGMAGGQALDLEAETAAEPLGAAAVERLQAMKTGALLRFAVEAGAILGGANPEGRTALVGYGNALGAAFQIADDILDAEGDEVALGKRAGKDSARNKATLVSIHGLAAAKELCDRLVGEAEAAVTGAGFTGEHVDNLVQAARFVANRKS